MLKVIVLILDITGSVEAYELRGLEYQTRPECEAAIPVNLETVSEFAHRLNGERFRVICVEAGKPIPLDKDLWFQ